MRHDGYFYLYCSSHLAQIKCWRSENLTEWTYMGSVCDLPEIEGAYAPEVLYTHGRFYMVTAPKGSGHYLLAADAPTGPFSLVSENFGLLIDGSLFADDDGRVYFTRAGHRGIEIHDVDLPNTPTTAGKIIPESYLNHWTEGPMIIKREGLYFLTITGNHLLSRGYRIDYIVSPEGPDKGYQTPRNPTLLLEVGDEFHALGHSSTVLGPDMDSWFIAYHSFNFLAEPRYRSLNIDRLSFDGGRMYTNAAWWPQAAPAGPVFTSRGGEGMPQAQREGKIFWMTPPMGRTFTAEFNINPQGKSVVLLLDDASPLHIASDGIALRDGAKKPLPTNINWNAHLTIRVAQGRKAFRVWLNGMTVLEIPTAAFSLSGEAGMGLWTEANTLPGFVGFSHTAEGSGDHTAAINIPGRFPAVHTESAPPETQSHTDFGLPARAMRPSPSPVSYQINVKETGSYTLFLRLEAEAKQATLSVNGQALALDNLTTQGFTTVCAGVITLNKTDKKLQLSQITGIRLLDELTLIPAATAPESLSVIEKGRLIHSPLRILGHKRGNSMLRKEWGFTCAENFGVGYVGEDGWTDYTLEAGLNINRHTNGTASLYLRATKESWFEHQATPSLLGYRVKADSKGISLSRCHYGEELLGRIEFGADITTKVNITVSVQGGKIAVHCHGAKLEYTDTHYPHGKAGLEATGEGWGFERFIVGKTHGGTGWAKSPPVA
ncbi:MAG: family 43 glycosylhydrolase [Defluviitaleaceae bacterium]|nr:family 43 glycosylhydrolase [Defluviitaleaceae bacterium]MCL2238936.1 family 43 glycosylhydrolase [Defluviitaleaceae bacterium]